MTDIETTLARIEERLASHVTSNGAWQQRVESKLRGIDVSLRGNGDSPGLGTRLDRIEQREAGRTKLVWVAVTAATGALAAWIKDIIGK